MSLERRFRWLMLGIDPADIMKTVDLARRGKLVCVDGDREDVLPGIDLRAAFDTHTWGSMYVTVRNDGARNSQDTWIFAGDLLYTYDNLTGLDKDNPQFVPIGLAVGSQSNLIFATAAMLKAVGGEHRRVIPIHEDRLKDMFPSRLTSAKLQVVEITLSAGETSKVSS